MGYTQYFEQIGPQPTDGEWKAIVALVKEILESHSENVCEEFNRASAAPIINKKEIIFNGKGDLGHETFVLCRNQEGFNFCKTAQKPYDAAVVDVLRAVKRVCPHWLRLSSDGDEPDNSVF